MSAVIFSPVLANTQGYHSVNYKDYGAIINAAWDKLVSHVTDPVEKTNILKPIIEPRQGQKPLHKGYRQQHVPRSGAIHWLFQAEAYHNIEEVEVFGAIIYLKTDQAARQKLMLFGRSNTLKNLLADANIDIRRIIDVLTTGLKYVLVHSLTVCR